MTNGYSIAQNYTSTPGAYAHAKIAGDTIHSKWSVFNMNKFIVAI